MAVAHDNAPRRCAITVGGIDVVGYRRLDNPDAVGFVGQRLQGEHPNPPFTECTSGQSDGHRGIANVSPTIIENNAASDIASSEEKLKSLTARDSGMMKAIAALSPPLGIIYHRYQETL